VIILKILPVFPRKHRESPHHKIINKNQDRRIIITTIKKEEILVNSITIQSSIPENLYLNIPRSHVGNITDPLHQKGDSDIRIEIIKPNNHTEIIVIDIRESIKVINNNFK
jgi:hypothetical protein